MEEDYLNPAVRLITTKTSDGYILDGFVARPQSGDVDRRACVVHVHGLAGNFYENSFLRALARELPARGYSFVSGNLRGHDYLADVLRESKRARSYDRLGGAHDSQIGSEADIRAWTRAGMGTGCKHFVLQGHSLGCAKILSFLSRAEHAFPSLAGVVLLAPSDDLGVVREEIGPSRYGTICRKAAKLVKAGAGDTILLPDPIPGYPLSASTFLDLLGPDGICSLLRVERGHLSDMGKRVVGNLGVPILTIFGSRDTTTKAGPLGQAKAITDVAEDGKSRYAIVKNAPHSFVGAERRVARLVGGWVADVCPD